jgi:uncharacterized protein YecE (DUF72 family)
VTASFVYARIMGTQEHEACGYSGAALSAWAERARTWAAGGAPKDLDPAAPAPSIQAREVFLYVIAGFKPRNPLAALALIDKLA